MRLKTIVKLGTVVSVLLFVLAVGYYAFMRLDMTGQQRNVNLFSMVPASCISVLESDDINAFWREYPNLNYSRELDEFQFPGLFQFLISELNEYTGDTHGLSKQMSRLLVSFHRICCKNMYQEISFRKKRLIEERCCGFIHCRTMNI